MEKILVITGDDRNVLYDETGFSMMHALLHPHCSSDCLHVLSNEAFSDITGIVEREIKRGVMDFLVVPLGVSPGVSDPIVKEIIEGFPSVKIRPMESTDSLKTIEDLRKEALSPEGIEQRSFDLLTEEDPAINQRFSREEQAIVKRVVHSTADFDFVREILFHPDAIRHGITMISEGRNILTDIEMVRAGISKKLAVRFGCKILCGLNSHEMPERKPSQTRTEAAIEFMMKQNNNIGIVVVGNAPTALLKSIEILNSDGVEETPLVVGVPVGFVKALESKVLLSMQRFPFITNLSRKGGTPVAVAVVNALLRLAYSL
jgi:precorrin-8X/cobalt-precorrin-8 methylmutase